MVTKKPQPSAQRPTVLLVCEPNSPLHQAAEELKAEGFRVRHARSTYRAIVEQTNAPAEIILVDTTPLLERDMEVFEVLRSLGPSPFVLASFPPSARQKAGLALQRGADAYVLEPFDAREVTVLLRRSLERRAAPAREKPISDHLVSLARFAAGVAHEINNPLTTVSGWVQLTLSDMDPNDPARRTFETMQEEIDRIAAIVRNLLCFAGQPPLEEEPVDINELLDELLTALAPEGIHVACYLHEDLPLILANRAQIRQACELLLRYALKALEGRGELIVATRPVNDQDQVVVEIAHDGLGLPPDHLSHIFDPFFEDGDGGGGLGLSAAYGIIQGHGGAVEVTSQEGEGARFVVRLPLHRLRTRNRILGYAK